MCIKYPTCLSEFRMSATQKEKCLSRALQLDRSRAAVPFMYPYLWEIKSAQEIVRHTERTEFNYMFVEGNGGPGVCVHISAYTVTPEGVKWTSLPNKYSEADSAFKAELLTGFFPKWVHGAQVDLEAAQRSREKEELDEKIEQVSLPESWEPPPPDDEPNTGPPGDNISKVLDEAGVKYWTRRSSESLPD